MLLVCFIQEDSACFERCRKRLMELAENDAAALNLLLKVLYTTKINIT